MMGDLGMTRMVREQKDHGEDQSSYIKDLKWTSRQTQRFLDQDQTTVAVAFKFQK